MEITTNLNRNLLKNDDNDQNILRDSLVGFTAVNQNLVLLDYGNIVVRRDYYGMKTIRLVSGGLAGPDLNHASFVGKGMLTAAVLGDEATPSSRLILRTLKELNEGSDNPGIFVIAQANPELFNFGLAVERATADCRSRMKLLSIDDDKSPDKQRNTCGAILLIKVLGAMAEEGALYDDIVQCYDSIINGIVTVPLNYEDEEVGPRRRKSIKLSIDFEANVKCIIDKTSQMNLGLHPSIPTVALINTPKSMDKMAEYALVKQVVCRLREFGACVVRFYLGNFVTIKPGNAALTILRIHDNKLLEYLDAPCSATGWSHVKQFLPEVSIRNEVTGVLKNQGKQHVLLKGPKLGEKAALTLTRSVQFACDALISCERQLNIIDSENSVGNVGTRLKSMSTHVNQRLNNKRLPVHCPYAFFKKLSVITETAIGGTMGSIYGIIFDSAANVFGESASDVNITPELWTKALTAATEAVKKCTSDEMECTTMYLPIKACEFAVSKALAKERHFIEAFGFGISQAEEAAQKTRQRSCKYADSGAHAVGIWMRAVFEGVKLMCSDSI